MYLHSSSVLLSCMLLTCWVSVLLGVQSLDLTSLFHPTTAPQNVQFTDDGQQIELSLDETNAPGFESSDAYLFGEFNMRVKLAPGDSAGTVTTYYFSSLGDFRDELDFEFLGNTSGQPIILQTNVYANGIGGREQRIFLWFDPTTDFHNYSLLWNSEQVFFFVDGIPIRVYPNIEAEKGVPYLHNQSLNVYGTIWDGDSWATEGGRVKIDWTHSPFVASYRDFSADACSQTTTMSASECAQSKWWDQLAYQGLNEQQLAAFNWVKQNLTVYDYCTDFQRYNVTPPECLYSVPLSNAAVSPPLLTPSSTFSGPSIAALSPEASLGPSGSPASSSALVPFQTLLFTSFTAMFPLLCIPFL